MAQFLMKPSRIATRVFTSNSSAHYWFGSASHYGVSSNVQPREVSEPDQATVVDTMAYFIRGLDAQAPAREAPILVTSQRAPWLDLPLQAFLNTMTTI